MIVKRLVKTIDGQVEATLVLTPEQAAFILNTGLLVLMQQGATQIQNISEEEFTRLQQEEQIIRRKQEDQDTTVSDKNTENGAVIVADGDDKTKSVEQQQKEFLASTPVKLMFNS